MSEQIRLSILIADMFSAPGVKLDDTREQVFVCVTDKIPFRMCSSFTIESSGKAKGASSLVGTISKFSPGTHNFFMIHVPKGGTSFTIYMLRDISTYQWYKVEINRRPNSLSSKFREFSDVSYALNNIPAMVSTCSLLDTNLESSAFRVALNQCLSETP